MIRTEILYDIRPIEQARLFIELFPDLLQDEVIAAFNRDIRPFLLAGLQYEPGPAKMPFEFASEKSRRYYFWLVSQGKVKTANGHYVRSHKLSKGWRVGISADEDIVVMSAENRVKYERWVSGPRQIRGHAATGWVQRQKTIAFWTEAAAESTMKVADRLLGSGF